jgi:hypothetical protein
MRSGTSRRAQGAPGNLHRSRLGVVAAIALALAASGCTTSGQPTPFSTAPAGTLAFESIDGPPAGVFHKLVQNLDNEAQARKLPVVSREGPSQYRARGYLAAHIARGRTTIAWVWDVYDAQERRVLRVSGEEPAGRNVRDAWNGADDGVLRKIARASLDDLSGLVGGPAPAPAIETQPSPDVAVALAAAQP